jgi:SpoU rRNA methylase family enzyme
MNAPAVVLSIAGHAGIGHTLCPGGLIQDDSLGFAVAGSIIRDILGADTHVKSVDVDPDRNTIVVTTVDGGIGRSSPRRGITPSEARLIGAIEDRDALFCQTVAIEAMGRVYGQGVLETPTALEGALANAAIDTFHKKAPDRFHMTSESVAGNSGLMGGMSAEIGATRVSVAATVNESSSGVGPNEDLEGNVALGSKRELMGKLGMMRCPTIVLEGKAYSPALSDGLTQTTFLVRVQRDLDNIVVAEALHDAAKELGYPVIFLDDAFPRNEGALRRRTVEVAERIIATAGQLKMAELGSQKVSVAAELARLVSQEVGGVSFMTDKLYDVVRQCGLIPGTSAVLSMLVTREYLEHWKMPLLEQEDIDRMTNIVYAAVPRIASKIHEANAVLDRLYEDLTPLESLIG